MQKVACPMMIVSRPNLTPTVSYVVRSANPLMMPGRASGRITTSEIASRPKKSKRETASDAKVPSTRATAVAPSAARTDSQSAWRTPPSW